MTSTLVLVRHGESEWNKLNLFTGWKDPDLTAKGVAEAKAGGSAPFWTPIAIGQEQIFAIYFCCRNVRRLYVNNLLFREFFGVRFFSGATHTGMENSDK